MLRHELHHNALGHAMVHQNLYKPLQNSIQSLAALQLSTPCYATPKHEYLYNTLQCAKLCYATTNHMIICISLHPTMLSHATTHHTVLCYATTWIFLRLAALSHATTHNTMPRHNMNMSTTHYAKPCHNTPRCPTTRLAMPCFNTPRYDIPWDTTPQPLYSRGTLNVTPSPLATPPSDTPQPSSRPQDATSQRLFSHPLTLTKHPSDGTMSQRTVSISISVTLPHFSSLLIMIVRMSTECSRKLE